MTKTSQANAGLGAVLERKLARTRRRLFLERMWPRVWIIIGAALTFLALSLFDVWAMLPTLGHQLLLGILGVIALGGLAVVARTDYPSRDAALRHLEATSNVPHRPATTAADTVSGSADDPIARAIWDAHQKRMADEAKRLRVAPARPRTDRFDPIALRAAAVLMVALGAGLAGTTIPDRIASAFDFGQQAARAASARLDAWITPPTYTSRPAIILSDGGRRKPGATQIKAPGLTDEVITVPEGSTVTVRTSGDGVGALSIQLMTADGTIVGDTRDVEVKSEDASPEATAEAQDEQSDDARRAIQDAKIKLAPDVAKIVARLGSSISKTWTIKVTPDLAPVIAQTKPHEPTRRGAMKLFYSVTDDFGVASAEARFVPLPPDDEDPRTQWARPDALTGPRLPLARAPVVSLRLPGRRSKDGKTWSFHDIGSHPWAGMRVRMTLIAKDHAGNVGRSKSYDIRLPQRQFTRQLAKAVIEQRRNLVIDDRYQRLVRRAVDAITMAPKGFINDLGAYTGLRAVYHRLGQPATRPALDETIKRMWHLAVRIEDGRGLSDAERRLRELQQKLSEAIQNGASDKEIRELMKQLRQALNKFMQELARRSQQMPQQQQGRNQQQQTLSQQDLNKMLRDLENMARQGSKDQAQEMLSQLRDLIDRMQSGRMARNGQQNQQSQQMMEMLNKYGDIIGKQQRLMDETHNERRAPGEQGQQQGQRGQRGQQGQGQRGQGQQGQGQRGQGQRGQAQRGQGQGQRGQGQQQGQNGQRGQQPGQGQGRDQGGQQQGGQGGTLANRQGQLGQMLDELQRQLEGQGLRGPGQMEGARDSMESARRALEQGDLDTAAREQARALEQLRKGAQSMAQQMLQQMPSRYGRAGDAPLDPLGRPQRTDGPDNGSTVKVPGEIETQRAREILEELRKRLGQPQRPDVELDYIERLLERF